MQERVQTVAVIAALLIVGAAATFAAEEPKTGVAAITVPEGFTVERVAGPPLVERPMLASFDDRGRLYVGDSAGVNLRGPELTKNPPHSIRMLEDTDGDGKFDKSTRVRRQDGLSAGDRLARRRGLLLVAAQFLATGRYRRRRRGRPARGVGDRFCQHRRGRRHARRQPGARRPAVLVRRPLPARDSPTRRTGDPQGDRALVVRCRPDGSDLEVVCGSQGNAVGVAFTPEGDMFASGTFLAPNSMGAGLRDALVHCIDGGEYPVRDRVLNEHKRTGDLLPPLTHLGVAAASDLAIARGDALGERVSRQLVFGAV